MTRRDWLIRVLGATVAATVAPLLDLTDQTPAFWNQPPLKKLLPWRIQFPDGMTYSFDAKVVAEELLEDGTVSFTLRPTGPTKISQEISYPMRFIGEPDDDRRAEDVPSPHAPETVLHIENGIVMTLHNIVVPELTRCDDDVDNYVLGQLRRGSMTIKVKPV